MGSKKIPLKKLMNYSIASGAIQLHERNFDELGIGRIDYTVVKGPIRESDFENTIFFRYHSLSCES